MRLSLSRDLCFYMACWQNMFIWYLFRGLQMYLFVLVLCVFWVSFCFIGTVCLSTFCVCFTLKRLHNGCTITLYHKLCVFRPFETKLSVRVFRPLSQSSVCVCFSTFEPKLSVRVFRHWIVRVLPNFDVCPCEIPKVNWSKDTNWYS